METETYVFSLGVSHSLPMKKEDNKKKKCSEKNKKKGKSFYYEIPKQIFSIAPNSFYSSPHIAHLCSFLPLGMKKQEEWCKGWEKNPYLYTPLETPACFQDLPEVFWSSSWADTLREWIPRIYALRWKLRRFLHKWRFTRLQRVNTEDVVTCEEPVHPIHVVDWNRKQVWVFEASTLMRDITNRLSHHDGFFEHPQPSRNPLTNLPLTSSQVISVWNQLTDAPVNKSNVFTAFRVSRMNLNSFRYDYRIPLQMHALRRTMAEFTHYDAIERLLDFIDMAYDRQEALCDFDVWDYVVRHFPNHEIIIRWRALCLKYYELELRYDSFPQQKEVQQNKIWSLTFPLLHKQQELIPLLPLHILEDVEEHLLQTIHTLNSITVPIVIIPDLNQ
jgi:hypothetical protein